MAFIKNLFIYLFPVVLFSQDYSSYVQPISIENNDDYSGFDLLEVENNALFVLAEHWHNIRSVPTATLKTLQYLHEKANVRVLAIEHGKSTAFMINDYLQTGDESMLEHITRNTMFWAQENKAFFQDLRAFNLQQSEEDQIVVESIDIEYKMEAAIFLINQFIGNKKIPNSLAPTL